MRFEVIPNNQHVPLQGHDTAYLWADNWNDHGFKSMYHLKYFDLTGKRYDIGALKIGEFNMREKQFYPNIPSSFDCLSEKFFSLGQDADYYSNIMSLNNVKARKQLLTSLNDIAANEDLYSRASTEKIANVSLLRFLTNRTIEVQFRRILSGGARLTEYSFCYLESSTLQEEVNHVELKFDVKPESRPPTNIHVLIGGNGVGKTHILNSMIRILKSPGRKNNEDGRILANCDNDTFPFANVVHVSFSAFDDFQYFQEHGSNSNDIQFTYIGLQDIVNKEATLTKNPDQLAEEFSNSAKLCTKGAKADRWKKALNVLEIDSVFADAEVANLVHLSDDDFRRESLAIYKQLSSGHKIVLLTITKLIECVQEKTLVLMEEPEEHLHPPLLSAFIRALSDLLINRNGVAIVATHSPIVLQEVPRSCVWGIYRYGSYIKARRPNRQTFAENVGILTSEIFGLEVTQSGFHKMLNEESVDATSVDEVLAKFDDGIGTEGRALVSGRVASNLRNKSKCGV